MSWHKGIAVLSLMTLESWLLSPTAPLPLSLSAALISLWFTIRRLPRSPDSLSPTEGGVINDSIGRHNNGFNHHALTVADDSTMHGSIGSRPCKNVNAPHGSWGIVSLEPKILLERVVRYAFLAQIYKLFVFLNSFVLSSHRCFVFSIRLTSSFSAQKWV